jgi:uncharacterized protein (TIGR00369 family)
MLADAGWPAPTWSPAREDYRAHVQAVFERSAATGLLGCALGRIEPGYAEVELPCRKEVTQQHGFVHGGVLGVIADTAAALAALTVAPAGSTGMTVEYKINLLEAAWGEKIIARGRLIRPGHLVTIAGADLYAITRTGQEHFVATALVTLAWTQRRRRTPTIQRLPGTERPGKPCR